MADPLYLVADVGGTNTRVALAHGRAVEQGTIRRYRNRDFENLAPLLAQYRADHGSAEPDGACVAVAGPVADGRADMTNLDWSIDVDRLVAATGAHHGALLNDLQAQGHALGHVDASQIQTVIEAEATANAARLVIGIGTGFNAAPVHAMPHGRFVPPCEAGHVSFPVRSDADRRLCDVIAVEHPAPSVEDVLSGRGLEQIYRWLVSEAGSSEEFMAAEIMARVGRDPHAEAAVRHFVRLLGIVAGDLALIHLPLGGIYLVGGVARAMGPHLADMAFADSFRDKGRFEDYMANFAVHMIVDDFAALTGCAAHLHEKSP